MVVEEPHRLKKADTVMLHFLVVAAELFSFWPIKDTTICLELARVGTGSEPCHNTWVVLSVRN